MTAHPLTNRLQQHRHRIAGMLMPGARMVSDRTTRHLTSLLPGFGGLKFQLAARKMRSIDPARLGSLQPGRILRPLIAPLEKAENLLHLKLAYEADAAGWSEIETVFPVPFSEPEPTPQEGVLRPGSVIPRMPTFPKPGQTLESFKEQVQSRPAAPPPAEETPRPRIAPPNARRFSRIQEFRTEKPSEEPPVEAEAAAEVQRQPDSASKPSVEMPHSKKVEPQQEMPPEQVAAPSVTPPEKQELKEAAKPVASLPTSPLITDRPPLAHPLEPKKEPARELPVAPVVPLPKAAPKTTPKSTRTDLPVAKAVSTRKTPPPAKVTPAPTPKPASKRSAPRPQPSKPSQVMQSEPAKLLPPAEPTPLPAAVEPSIPIQAASSVSVPQIDQPQEESRPAESLPAEPESPVQLPIRKQARFRRQAPEKLKTLQPQEVRPQIAQPKSARPQKPLIPPQKYHLASAAVARQPDLPGATLLRPGPSHTDDAQNDLRPASPQPTSAQNEPEDVYLPPQQSTQPVSMALAYPPRMLSHPHETSATPAPELEKPDRKSDRKSPAPAASSRVAGLSNVVQRNKWPENEGGSGATASAGGSAEASGSQAATAAPDLSKLAEDVFPYVKRLIEIESDRLSSRFS